MQSSRRIVLAYSGGLDTSIILKWLQENYNAEVITYTAEVGQKINKKKIRLMHIGQSLLGNFIIPNMKK